VESDGALAGGAILPREGVGRDDADDSEPTYRVFMVDIG
jgi:hypothetical protein